MEFGRVLYDNLNEETFIFQIPENINLAGTRYPNAKIHIGLPKWNDESWKGKLFPLKAKNNELLTYYAGKFTTLEFNATHYKYFPDTQFQRWLNNVEGQEFTFCPKFPKDITHKGKITFESKGEATDLFFNGILTLGDKLGPAWLQISELYRSTNKKDLLQYLSFLSLEIGVFVETRHHSWFDKQEDIISFSNELQKLGKGWLMTDTPGRRDVLHFQFPIPKMFIRFVCMGDHELDIFRIAQWKSVLNFLFANGLEDCWFFIHAYNDSAAPDFAEFVKLELEPCVL